MQRTLLRNLRHFMNAGVRAGFEIYFGAGATHVEPRMVEILLECLTNLQKTKMGCVNNTRGTPCYLADP